MQKVMDEKVLKVQARQIVDSWKWEFSRNMPVRTSHDLIIHSYVDAIVDHCVSHDDYSHGYVVGLRSALFFLGYAHEELDLLWAEIQTAYREVLRSA